MPAGVFNRAADNWRPLLAIADAAGGEWPAARAEPCNAAGQAQPATTNPSACSCYPTFARSSLNATWTAYRPPS